MPRDGAQIGQAEVVEIGQSTAARARWGPVVGEETLALLDHLAGLSDPEKIALRGEAASILGRCGPPTAADETQTGLVVGHVQSGKTMSFTTVAALARDNGYQLVVVITGTSVPLFTQSTRRLERDLRLQVRGDRAWQLFKNPRPRDRAHDRQAMQGTLGDWLDGAVPARQRETILIAVMKNHRHLSSVTLLLEQLDLSGIPALVIDDEADQAGLNTQVRQGEQSATYRCLLALRRALPHHSYLQYTATPQAPLLINLIDVLSPRFAKVLTPGADYVGGRELIGGDQRLVEVIPAHEIPTRDAPLREPPPSLLRAMQVYFIGVAAGHVLDGLRGNRSMMVHPSQEVLRHAEYGHWVGQARQQWMETLALQTGDPDQQDLVEEFRRAYDDVAATVPGLPDFNELCAALPRALRRTRIIEVNAARGGTPEVEWRSEYAHILVGGQALDRGFTVEGLTVTYMPRSMGVGNADTIQQRARFLGYKRSYLGYCRVFLEGTVLDAYRRYLVHEEDVRRQLAEYDAAGRPLAEWRRAFFLDSALRPTRLEVLDLDYVRGGYRNEWFDPKAPHDSPEAVENNRRLVDALRERLMLVEDAGDDRRSQMQRHPVAGDESLATIYETLLAPLQVTRPGDFYNYLGLQLQISAHLEANQNARCAVYFISGGAQRDRTLGTDDEIPNLFQGPNPGRDRTYPGDREIRVEGKLTIQVHRLRLLEHGSTTVRAQDVPAIAVWVPAVMAEDWVVQERPRPRA